MTKPTPAFIAPVVTVLAVSGVLFAGLGGMIVGDSLYPLLGAGALFCLLMILVFTMVLGNFASSEGRYAIAGGYGALAGVCVSLYFYPGTGWAGLLATAALGAVCALIRQWRSEIFSDQ